MKRRKKRCKNGSRSWWLRLLNYISSLTIICRRSCSRILRIGSQIVWCIMRASLRIKSSSINWPWPVRRQIHQMLRCLAGVQAKANSKVQKKSGKSFRSSWKNLNNLNQLANSWRWTFSTSRRNSNNIEACSPVKDNSRGGLEESAPRAPKVDSLQQPRWAPGLQEMQVHCWTGVTPRSRWRNRSWTQIKHSTVRSRKKRTRQRIPSTKASWI